jgi:hypothetical protein
MTVGTCSAYVDSVKIETNMMKRFNDAVQAIDAALPLCDRFSVEQLLEFLDDEPTAPAELANELRSAWVDLQSSKSISRTSGQ